MELRSLSRLDSSSIGTAVGLTVALVAIVGSEFLGWKWNSSLDQPVPLVIGLIVAVLAVAVTVQKFRS